MCFTNNKYFYQFCVNYNWTSIVRTQIVHKYKTSGEMYVIEIEEMYLVIIKNQATCQSNTQNNVNSLLS